MEARNSVADFSEKVRSKSNKADKRIKQRNYGRDFGWDARIRTSIARVRVWRPAIGRHPKKRAKYSDWLQKGQVEMHAKKEHKSPKTRLLLKTFRKLPSKLIKGSIWLSTAEELCVTRPVHCPPTPIGYRCSAAVLFETRPSQRMM